jgi:hypothetical protein
LAIARREVGSCDSSPACPARVSFAGCVLPSGPSPGSGLSPPPSTLPDKTPQGHLAATRPPVAWFSDKGLGSSLVLCPGFPLRASLTAYLLFVVPTALDSSVVPFPGFPFGASIAVYPHRAVPTSGTLGASRVLRRFSSGMPRPVDSGGPSYPRPGRYFWCCLRGTLKPSASATNLSRSCIRTSGCASPLRPTGCSVYASPALFAVFSTTPPRTPDSIRVGGWPLPDGDFHPARNAELVSARQRPGCAARPHQPES